MNSENKTINKIPTGIRGFDEISHGGLPEKRISLITGGPGAGKTIFGMFFANENCNEAQGPALFISFEESKQNIVKNAEAFNIDFSKSIEEGNLRIEYMNFDIADLQTEGEFDLSGLFSQIDYLLNETGAKKLVIDSADAILFSDLEKSLLRRETKKLFNYLNQKGVTTLITSGENIKGSGHTIHEYLSDCVIILDTEIKNNDVIRKLRIKKYRGSSHETQQFPFAIAEDGFTVHPVTSMKLDYESSERLLSTGHKELDQMLGGGLYEGSTIMIAGGSGSGKTTLLNTFVQNFCEQNKKILYFGYEEAPAQIKRNMKSIGFDIEKYDSEGKLQFKNSRPNTLGPETHLLNIIKAVDKNKPDIVFMDPVSSLMGQNYTGEIELMIGRIIDFLKSRNITFFMSYVATVHFGEKETQEGLSSLVDTWISLTNRELNGETNRFIDIIKSRGMNPSNQVREFIMTDEGIKLADVYISSSGEIFAGTSKIAQQKKDEQERAAKKNEIENKKQTLEQKKKAFEAKISELKAQYNNEIALLENEIDNLTKMQEIEELSRENQKASRQDSS